MIDVERIDFVSVPVREAGRMREFYGRTLGLVESTPPDSRCPEFEAGNVTLAFWMPERDGEPFAPNAAGIALRVRDVAEVRARLEATGVEFSGETIDTGVCHMAFCRDPDGNTLILHRRYAPPRSEERGG